MITVGSSLDVLPGMAANSIDSCITDPPYELGFMGRSWDRSGIAFNVDLWREVLRVMKPGAHLLAFGGTRTYHRMACAIEDAGFEIRDSIMWIYGSGFPKSMDVSKAIDREAGASREVIGTQADRWTGKGTALNFATDRPQSEIDVLGGPATPAAKRWEGWGTALKPAYEPIVLARKPIEGTVAANVQRWECGALNIDGCRVGSETLEYRTTSYRDSASGEFSSQGKTNYSTGEKSVIGRFPANLIHDGSDEVVSRFPDAGGGFGKRGGRGDSTSSDFAMGGTLETVGYGDSGSASRFFYCAKASGRERGAGNTHPTVKPLALMRYLCRLVTPPGGSVLDPFTGSGSTLIAAKAERFDPVGIELSPEYAAIAERRLVEAFGPLGVLCSDLPRHDVVFA